MEQDRYEELLNTLRKWRDWFAENLLERVESVDRHHNQAEIIYTNEGVGEDFAPWLDRFCRQLVIQFILKILFIRVLEDRGLLKIRRIRSRDSQQLFEALAPHLGATSYLRFVFRDVARLLPDLFEEGEQDFLWPADHLSQEFLEEVWRRPDVEREGRLRYDFRGDGQGGFDTRFIGDFYQDIDAEAREYYALLQTPEFISQFILEHTLIKKFDGKDFRDVTIIDPACGSGHFLVDAFYHFAQEYLQAGDFAETPSEKAKLARKVIEEHIFGADINPYACALTRFRLMLVACDFTHPTDLEAFREQNFNIVCCDSLIPYEKQDLVGIQIGLDQNQIDVAGEMKRRFGSLETIAEARDLFSREYDVVVANPPYISVKDPLKRDFYRNHYKSAYGKFGLVAPFIERSLSISTKELDGGQVGLIISNAFARRVYGKKLIEEVLPNYDLQTIIDLDGVHIPGHGTPTLIMFLRNGSPGTDPITVLSTLRGEEGIPSDPAEGIVWNRVLHGVKEGYRYHDEYVDVYDYQRSVMSKHPWNFGGLTNRLFEDIKKANPHKLEEIAEIGFEAIPGLDDVYVMDLHVARRLSIPSEYIREFVVGEINRDWSVTPKDVIIYPYREKHPVNIESACALNDYLETYRHLLEKRKTFGKTQLERGLPWFEYVMMMWAKRDTPTSLIFPKIATHNHLYFDRGDCVVNSCTYLLKLIHEKEWLYLVLLGLLNSSLANFCLKQISFNKGTGDDVVRDRYHFQAGTVGQTPIPGDLSIKRSNIKSICSLSKLMDDLGRKKSDLIMKKIFDKSGEAYVEWNRLILKHVDFRPIDNEFTDPLDLSALKKKLIRETERVRERMIFLQEEIDWLTYDIYGLIPRAPLAVDYLTPDDFDSARLELGQRAFERVGNGYKGDWPEDWLEGSQDHLPGPVAQLPELSGNMKRLIQDRVQIIRTNESIVLLEDPLYKRRWVPPDYEKEFREALEWWMREMAERELELAGKPLHIKEWSRRLMAHERVRAALEIYMGTPTYDPVGTIDKIIETEAGANRPEHFMTTSGLRKLARGEMRFRREDFSDGDAWRVRGKLNIPRERYIAYKEFEPGWYGWAGWDAEMRAEALVYLLEQAATEGWFVHHRQCGLRASLRDLLPNLDDIPTAEKQEFETIAYLCGISEPCFCTPFREAEIEERPPGFDEPSIKQRVTEANSAQISLF